MCAQLYLHFKLHNYTTLPVLLVDFPQVDQDNIPFSIQSIQPIIVLMMQELHT